jgi:hypothetical protein
LKKIQINGKISHGFGLEELTLLNVQASKNNMHILYNTSQNVKDIFTEIEKVILFKAFLFAYVSCTGSPIVTFPYMLAMYLS